jgi:CIC family chloride channel protein
MKFGAYIAWRISKISERNFLYILSFVIGLLTGTAALTLKNLIHIVPALLTSRLSESHESFLYLAYPMLGIFITVLIVRYLIRDNLGHGIEKILYAISRKKGELETHHTFSSVITSSFTIGFGGSVGAESPIVLTGAAIGSNLAQYFKLDYNAIRLMIGCGATGAIAGIFNAPIAGIVFTLEVLMLDLTMASLVPLLISGITAAVLAYFFMGESVLLKFTLTHAFETANIPYYILLGIFIGFVSLYFTRLSMFVEGLYKKIRKFYIRLLVGGLVLGILVFLFPSLWGEGYISVSNIFKGNGADLLNNSIFYSFKNNPLSLLAVFVLIMVFKVVAMSSTSGAGGVGGIFAPSLFMGAVGGFFVAHALNTFFSLNLAEENFALAGMAGMMAGVMHAPLLGIFLIAEVTGGYQMFMPLIIVATVSYLTIMNFEPYSIYTKRLHREGNLLTHHKDKMVLHFMKVRDLIETDFEIVPPGLTLGELTYAIARSKRDLFPVVDENGLMKGMIKMNDIRNLIFDQNLYDKITVSDLMYMPEFYISPEDSMEVVVEKFRTSGRFNLAVIDQGKYLGFISRARVFSSYREKVADLSED